MHKFQESSHHYYLQASLLEDAWFSIKFIFINFYKNILIFYYEIVKSQNTHYCFFVMFSQFLSCVDLKENLANDFEFSTCLNKYSKSSMPTQLDLILSSKWKLVSAYF
jgi:hypothetical protein